MRLPSGDARLSRVLQQPPPSTPGSRELFADFGELMYEIQTFEMSLMGLVQTQGDELRGTENYGPFIEELFRLTAGRLRHRAKIEDDQVAELVTIAVNLRNMMVHGWLITAGMDGAAGVKTTEELREQLRLVHQTIHDATESLGAVWRAELDKLEEDDLTPDKVLELWQKAARDAGLGKGQ